MEQATKTKLCPFCGEEIQEMAKKCRFCGEWIEEKIVKQPREEAIEMRKAPAIEATPISSPDKKCLFYSKEWEKPSSLSIVHNVDYDILITENSFYLLRITKPFIKRMLGIIVILLGAILPGALLVGYFDKKNRNKTRAGWLDFNNNLLSDKYTKYIVIQIPLSALKKSLSIGGNAIFGGKFFAISYSGQEVNLKYRKQECARIMEFVNNL